MRGPLGGFEYELPGDVDRLEPAGDLARGGPRGDDLAQPRRASEPFFADRGKPQPFQNGLLGGVMASEVGQERVPIDLRATRRHNAHGGKGGVPHIVRSVAEVHADTDGKPIHLTALPRGFQQDPCHLAAVEQDVVGPFRGQSRAVDG